MQHPGGEVESQPQHPQEEARAEAPPAPRPRREAPPPSLHVDLGPGLLAVGLAAHGVFALGAGVLLALAPRLFPLAPPTTCPPQAPARLVSLAAVPEEGGPGLALVEEAGPQAPVEEAPADEALAPTPPILTARGGECLVLEVHNQLTRGPLQLEVEGLRIHPGPAAAPGGVHRVVVLVPQEVSAPDGHPLWVRLAGGAAGPEVRVPAGLLRASPAAGPARAQR